MAGAGADTIGRFFIAITAIASGLVAMAAACAIVGAAISFLTQSISITLR